jgi:hypothetical protein
LVDQRSVGDLFLNVNLNSRELLIRAEAKLCQGLAVFNLFNGLAVGPLKFKVLRREPEAAGDLLLKLPEGGVAVDCDNQGGHIRGSFVLDVNSIQKFSLEERVVGLDSSCALSLGLTHDVLQDFDHSDYYGVVFFVRADDFNALSNEAVLNGDPLAVHVPVEVVIDLDEEFDGLRDDGRILAMQCDVPHDLQLVQVLRGLHQLEGGELYSLCLFLGLDGLDGSIASVNVETVVAIGAIGVVGFLSGGRLAFE